MKRIKTDINSLRFAVIHIAKSLEKPPHDQNLSKSMPALTHRKTEWKKEVLATTMYKRNAGSSI